MRTLIRRSLPLIVVLLLLTPVAVFAQSGAAARLVELVFSEDESSVHIEDTIQSVARVTFTHDGQTYVMKAPVTIEVDSTFPLTESILTTDIAARVGVFAVEILSVSEPEELEIGYTTIEPSEDGNKLVSVSFRLTNLDDEPQRLSSSKSVFGVDDLGRKFDTLRVLGSDGSSCHEINPGESTECLAVFDVDPDVDIVNVEFHARDERVLPVPAVEDSEEDEEEE